MFACFLAVIAVTLTIRLLPSVSSENEREILSASSKVSTSAKFSTSVKACSKISMEDPDLTPFFKSQKNEDKHLLITWFNGLCGGTYMEMGALDGIMFSNSYFFNHEMSWKGVLVELGPKNFAALVKNRPDELATVHAAVCDSPRTLHYVENSAIGGIWEFTVQTWRDKWWPGVSIDAALPIPCLPLQEILDTHLSNEKLHFDFFSLDVEGAEFEVLQSLDYERVGFGVILCEASPHNEPKNLALRKFLEDKGYVFVENKDSSYWFVNGEFDRIYSTVLKKNYEPIV